MKRALLLFVASLLLKVAYGQTRLSGCYVGLEEMCHLTSSGKKVCYVDPARPLRKWYHLTSLQIEGDSVKVMLQPISIYKKDTLYSASDGAFYHYRGKIKLKGQMVFIDLTMTHCEYCAVPVDPAIKKKREHKALVGQVAEGGILINGYLFKPAKCIVYP